MTELEKHIKLFHLDFSKRHNKEQVIPYAQIGFKKIINEFQLFKKVLIM